METRTIDPGEAILFYIWRSPPMASGWFPGLATTLPEAGTFRYSPRGQRASGPRKDFVLRRPPKLATAQREAIKAALADKPDETTVRSKVEAVTKIQAEIAMLRFKGLQEIKSTLTEEQKSRIDERPGMGYMMLLGGFGGGGGRRSGGPN